MTKHVRFAAERIQNNVQSYLIYIVNYIFKVVFKICSYLSCHELYGIIKKKALESSCVWRHVLASFVTRIN